MIWDHISWGDMVSTAVFLLSGSAAVVTVTWFVNSKIDQLTKYHQKRLEEFRVENESGHQRIWERFDEYKESVMDGFVRKDMCSLLHNTTARSMEKLESKLDGVVSKVDELKTLILENK